MPAKLTNLRPMLAVEDLPRTIAFYRDRLGFTCVGTFGEPPVWCGMERDGQGIMFNTPPAAEVRRDVPRSSKDYQVYYFSTDDAGTLRAEFERRGATVGELRITVYGMKEFEVRDPDDHWLWFGQGTDELATERE